MKVVLFCGGRGLRMRDGGADVPKPLSVLGGRPLLWHLMRWYAAQGHTEFVLTLGYRGADVRACMQELAEPDWQVRYVDTGLDTPIGQRLVRVRGIVDKDDMFLANYADLLSDVPLCDVIEQFAASNAAAGLVAVRPQDSFHLVDLSDGPLVRRIGPVTQAPMWQNGGFFTMRPDVFDAIRPGEELVDEPFGRLAARGRLLAFPWEGFWAPLDTQKDRQRLEALHARHQQPWLPAPRRESESVA